MSDWILSETRYSRGGNGAKIQGDLARPDLGILSGEDRSIVGFADPAHKPLPQLQECYVRGEDLIANYPQSTQDNFGWHLALAVHRMGEFDILNVTVAVQTDLLDCHPMLDAIIPGKRLRVLTPEDNKDMPPSMHVAPRVDRASAITILAQSPGYAIVMMPSRDWPVTGLHAQDKRMHWRLFEEFLEKGVIRKARLWIAYTDLEPSDRMARELYSSLSEMPLPLTA